MLPVKLRKRRGAIELNKDGVNKYKQRSEGRGLTMNKSAKRYVRKYEWL